MIRVTISCNTALGTVGEGKANRLLAVTLDFVTEHLLCARLELGPRDNEVKKT